MKKRDCIWPFQCVCTGQFRCPIFCVFNDILHPTESYLQGYGWSHLGLKKKKTSDLKCIPEKDQMPHTSCQTLSAQMKLSLERWWALRECLSDSCIQPWVGAGRSCYFSVVSWTEKGSLPWSFSSARHRPKLGDEDWWLEAKIRSAVVSRGASPEDDRHSFNGPRIPLTQSSLAG